MGDEETRGEERCGEAEMPRDRDAPRLRQETLTLRDRDTRSYRQTERRKDRELRERPCQPLGLKEAGSPVCREKAADVGLSPGPLDTLRRAGEAQGAGWTDSWTDGGFTSQCPPQPDTARHPVGFWVRACCCVGWCVCVCTCACVVSVAGLVPHVHLSPCGCGSTRAPRVSGACLCDTVYFYVPCV